MEHEIHYNGVTMGAIASQITSLIIVYSTVYLSPSQRKHQSSASLALCGEFTGDRSIPRSNGQLRGKCFHSTKSSWPTVAISKAKLRPDFDLMPTPNSRAMAVFRVLFEERWLWPIECALYKRQSSLDTLCFYITKSPWSTSFNKPQKLSPCCLTKNSEWWRLIG